MPIKFKCPHCQKPLAAKEQMAGKKAACTACKKPLVIPTPVSQPADVEAFAAAAFSDQPPAAAKQEAAAPKAPKKIEFTCPFCDETIQFDSTLGGKKEPCPKCRRIIRVPLPNDDRPKDWRTVQTSGPSGALKAAQPELDGAWGSAVKGRVSGKALEEAGALPEVEEDEEVGIGVWIKRVAIALGVVALLGGGTMALMHQRTRKQEKDAIQHVLEATKEGLPPHLAAEVHRAVGEFYLRKGKAKEALKEFKNARALALAPADKKAAKGSLDGDFFLRRLAVSQVDLGGVPKEVLDGERIDWNDVSKELDRTLQGIRSVEARALALRSLTGPLIKKDQARLAISLVLPLKRPEDVKDGKYSPVQSQWIALLLQVDEKQAAEQAPPPQAGAPIVDRTVRVGYAEGKARKGDYPGAAELVKATGGTPRDRLEAALAVAAVAFEGGNQAEAANFTKLAEEISAELKGKLDPWARFQLASSLAHIDAAKAKELAKALPPEFKGWAQLELIQAQLAKTPNLAEAAIVEEIPDKESLPHALACEALARHNQPLDSDSARQLGEVLTGPRPQVFLNAGKALASLKP